VSIFQETSRFPARCLIAVRPLEAGLVQGEVFLSLEAGQVPQEEEGGGAGAEAGVGAGPILGGTEVDPGRGRRGGESLARPCLTGDGTREIERSRSPTSVSECLDLVSTQPNGNLRKNSEDSEFWRRLRWSWTGTQGEAGASLSCTLRTSSLPRMRGRQ